MMTSRWWRAKHDLSQTAAAPWFGVSRSRLRDFESGYRPPKDLHERILAAFIRFYGLDALARGVDKGRDTGRRRLSGRALICLARSSGNCGRSAAPLRRRESTQNFGTAAAALLGSDLG
jgi:hypothetical protein